MPTTQHTAEIRPAAQRGTTDLGWLISRHSFSFGRYMDPDRMGFRSLRVLNDDIVAPGGGFGEHGHDNMEIISWVLEGALEHADSTGRRGVIQPGDVQVMTAGAGIRHRELNASTTDAVHFLQIWIEPAQRDTEPGYREKHFPASGRGNRWQLLLSPDEADGSLKIGQDARMSVASLNRGATLAATIPAGRHGYLHLATGRVRIGETELEAGDALTLSGPGQLAIQSTVDSEMLLFDLG